MKYAILCDKNGNTECGSDGHLRVDARNSRANQLQDVRIYRSAFKKNFRHKYDFWTHVMFSNEVAGNGQPIKISNEED